MEQKVPSLTIAEVGAESHDKQGGNRKIENRHYSRKEYANMSHKDRYKLKRLREEEGIPANDGNKKAKTLSQMIVAKFMAETANSI